MMKLKKLKMSQSPTKDRMSQDQGKQWLSEQETTEVKFNMVATLGEEFCGTWGTMHDVEQDQGTRETGQQDQDPLNGKKLYE